MTILPLIIGALATGLLAVFSLQSGVASRLSHTADAQVVAANFQKDVQGAIQITTNPTSNNQCGQGTGTQLFAVQSSLDTSTQGGSYKYKISYVSVPVTSGSTTTYSLERLFCDNYSTTPSSQTVLAYDLSAGQAPPTLSCVAGVLASVCSASATQWVSASNVSLMSFMVQDSQGSFTYSLSASPLATLTSSAGSPNSNSTSAGCGFAAPGSGAYAQNLCFIDFTSLHGAALAQATGGGCLEMSVALPNGFNLYFCISLSGSTVLPWYLPTWTNAFLGNSINGAPFYTGVPGFPALYQRVQGGTTVITLSNITVTSPAGVPATGWQFVGVDAESTDLDESIAFSSDVPLSVIPNNEVVGYPLVGNACQYGALLSGNQTTTVTCLGGSSSNYSTVGTKTGTLMVTGVQPTQMSATLVGTGLEGAAFGLMLP